MSAGRLRRFRRRAGRHDHRGLGVERFDAGAVRGDDHLDSHVGGDGGAERRRHVHHDLSILDLDTIHLDQGGEGVLTRPELVGAGQGVGRHRQRVDLQAHFRSLDSDCSFGALPVGLVGLGSFRDSVIRLPLNAVKQKNTFLKESLNPLRRFSDPSLRVH